MDPFHDDFIDLHTFPRLKSDIFPFKRFSILPGGFAPRTSQFFFEHLMSDFLKNQIFIYVVWRKTNFGEFFTGSWIPVYSEFEEKKGTMKLPIVDLSPSGSYFKSFILNPPFWISFWCPPLSRPPRAGGAIGNFKSRLPSVIKKTASQRQGEIAKKNADIVKHFLQAALAEHKPTAWEISRKGEKHAKGKLVC